MKEGKEIDPLIIEKRKWSLLCQPFSFHCKLCHLLSHADFAFLSQMGQMQSKLNIGDTPIFKILLGYAGIDDVIIYTTSRWTVQPRPLLKINSTAFQHNSKMGTGLYRCFYCSM